MPARFSRRRVMSALAGTAILGPSGEAEARRLNPQEHFEVTRTELSVPGLDPAHDGLTIAQLSDLHVGRHTPDGRVIAAVRALNEAKPDLVVLTGDYVTTSRDPVERVPQLLSEITSPAFATLGNHDHWAGAAQLRKGLERAGITVLQNEHTVTRVRGAALAVLGVDDGQTGNDDVERTFQGAPSHGTRLVLAHAPPTADKLPAWADLVCLAGHTHGGQIVVPRLTPGLFRRVGQPYLRGVYRVRGNQLYVNRGLGFGRGSPLLRVGSDPELALITLRVG